MIKYQDRFIDVIHYIEANLDTKLDIEKLCRLANLSKHHFHRQCSSFFNMPVMSLVKLLRLKRAAYQLAYRTDDNILTIALKNGYDSHEAFSRVFRKYFHQSPSDFRNHPDWTPWHIQYEPILQLRNRIVSDHTFNVKLVDFPEILIAIMEHKGSPALLSYTIQRFIEWRKEHHLPPNKSRTFNLIYDDPSTVATDDYRFDIGCSIDRKIEKYKHTDIVNKTIPAGQCAVIRHIGSDDCIENAVRYLYSEWLPESQYEIRDFPLFFERVSFFPEVSEKDMVTDIYLPVI